MGFDELTESLPRVYRELTLSLIIDKTETLNLINLDNKLIKENKPIKNKKEKYNC